MSLLRLEADDPSVLELTGLALHDSLDIPEPPLRMVCSRCGALLACAGDTAHGPLFTSSWQHEPPDARPIFVNGRRLSRSKTIKWRQGRDELVESRGRPLHEPLLHGVTALLVVPAELAQDYCLGRLTQCCPRAPVPGESRRGHVIASAMAMCPSKPSSVAIFR